MFGSLLRMAGDIVGTAVVGTATVAEPFVDAAAEVLDAADEMIVSPTADVVGEVCESIKDVVR